MQSTDHAAAIPLQPIPAHTRIASWFSPTVLVSLGIAILLVFLIANPLWQLVSESLRDPDTSAFSLANYAKAFGRDRFIQAYTNTLQLGVVAAMFSALIAVPLAWGVSRTDMPGRDFVHFSVLLSFLIPPFVGAIGWILLGGPNSGWINRAWMSLTGASSGPVNIYSFGGLAFVVGLYTFPLIYVFTKSALDLVSTELEEAAAILGAGPARTTMLVTLPLVLPSIIGSSLLVFLEVLGLYGTAALLGIPAGFNVITTQLAAFFEFPIQVEVAAAFAMPLVGITVLLLGVQRMILSRRGYVTVTGKGGHRRPLEIGMGGWALLAYALIIAALGVFLPMYVILQSALSKSWALGFSVDNFTLYNFRQALFEQPSIRTTLFNTMQYALFTATFCTALGFAVAYIVQRRLLPGVGILTGLTVSPFAIPGIVLAICFYAAYAPPPLALYGTAAIIIIAFVTRFLPITFVNAKSALQGLHPELEEAVRIAGGGRAASLVHVVLPILKKALFGGWLLIFIFATRELSTAMFLTGPETRVLSVLTIEMSEEGRFEILAAVSLMLLAVSGTVCWIGTRVLGGDFMMRRH